jgi:peptidoglycan/LPS O-acetylase OafA/YrhL
VEPSLPKREPLKVIETYITTRLYLWHWIVILIAKAATAKLTGILWLQEPIRFGAIGAAIMLAFLSFRYFEKPMIGLGNKLAKMRRSGDLAQEHGQVVVRRSRQ